MCGTKGVVGLLAEGSDDYSRAPCGLCPPGTVRLKSSGTVASGGDANGFLSTEGWVGWGPPSTDRGAEGKKSLKRRGKKDVSEIGDPENREKERYGGGHQPPNRCFGVPFKCGLDIQGFQEGGDMKRAHVLIERLYIFLCIPTDLLLLP